MKQIRFTDIELVIPKRLRPSQNDEKILETVKQIIEEVQLIGDEALLKYTKKFDSDLIESIVYRVPDRPVRLKPELEKAIRLAAKNIDIFHTPEPKTVQKIETCEGVFCWKETRAIETVGLYIPGGSAPLFSSLLMLAIPAKRAGCSQIIVCTPPQENGEPCPEMCFVAQLLGIETLYLCGGAQAISALAFGTESVPKVDKILGPGNRFVTLAKQLVSADVAIDMPAGPSEVLIIADTSASATFVAADLLAQAEHGIDSQVILLSTSEDFLESIQAEIAVQLRSLSRKNIIRQCLNQSVQINVPDIKTALDISNRYAPEHLILNIQDPEKYLSQITSAGSVFLGEYASVSVGDYASGTNHTLPTNGFAASTSGISLESFQKTITVQTLSKVGIVTLSGAVEEMAGAEKLDAHANAMRVRRFAIESVGVQS